MPRAPKRGSFPATGLFQDDDGRTVLALVLDRQVDPLAVWAAESYAAHLPEGEFRATLETALLGSPQDVLASVLAEVDGGAGLTAQALEKLRRLHAALGEGEAAAPAKAPAKPKAAAKAASKPGGKAAPAAKPAPASSTARTTPAAAPAAPAAPAGGGKLEAISAILTALDEAAADWNVVYDYLVQECAIEPESYEGRDEALRAMTDDQTAELLARCQAGAMLEEAEVQRGPTDAGIVDVAPPPPDAHPSDQPFEGEAAAEPAAAASPAPGAEGADWGGAT